MIEFRPMPEPSRPSGAEGGGEAASPDGAFSEMLQRSLGKNIVRGYQEPAQEDAGQDGEGNDEFSPGAGSVAPWPLRSVPAPVVEHDVVQAEESLQGEPPQTVAEPVDGDDVTPHAPVPDSSIEPDPEPIIPAPTPQSTDPSSLATGTSGFVAGGEMTTSTSIQLSDAGPTERVPFGPAPAAFDSGTEPVLPKPEGPLFGRPDLGQVRVDLAPADNLTMPSGAIEMLSALGHEIASGESAQPSTTSSLSTPTLDGAEAIDPGPSSSDVIPIAAPGGSGEAAPVADVVPSQAPTPSPAAMVDRIMRVVEMRGQLPPPHRVVVELPQLEDVQVAVTVRGSVVHIASARGDAVPDAFRPMVGVLTAALAARGFTLNAETGGRDGGGYQDEASEKPFTPENVVKPRKGDDGLRI